MGVALAPLDGSDGCFSLDSPRSIEACRRRGVECSDLEERSDESFRQPRPPQHRQRRRNPSHPQGDGRRRGSGGHGKVDMAPLIRKERHEIKRHRLLREV